MTESHGEPGLPIRPDAVDQRQLSRSGPDCNGERATSIDGVIAAVVKRRHQMSDLEWKDVVFAPGETM